jgi:hypothetical protein
MQSPQERGREILAAEGDYCLSQEEPNVRFEFSDFTLQTAHFTLAEITPYGVTTSASDGIELSADARKSV